MAPLVERLLKSRSNSERVSERSSVVKSMKSGHNPTTIARREDPGCVIRNLWMLSDMIASQKREIMVLLAAAVVVLEALSSFGGIWARRSSAATCDGFENLLETRLLLLERMNEDRSDKRLV